MLAVGKTMSPICQACLFLLYTLVVIFNDTLSTSRRLARRKLWAGKQAVIFSDMIADVRHYLGTRWIFTQVPGGRAVQEVLTSSRRAGLWAHPGHLIRKKSSLHLLVNESGPDQFGLLQTTRQF